MCIYKNKNSIPTSIDDHIGVPLPLTSESTGLENRKQIFPSYPHPHALK